MKILVDVLSHYIYEKKIVDLINIIPAKKWRLSFNYILHKNFLEILIKLTFYYFFISGPMDTTTIAGLKSLSPILKPFCISSTIVPSTFSL